MQQTDKQLFRLLISTLSLLGVSLLIGFGILMVMAHPTWFTSPPLPQQASATRPTVEMDQVANGLDVASGFIAEGNYLLVKQTCTACHSSKLVTQNRATREGWLEMIRWMQQTQKLWDLGENEDKILDYLAEHYGPTEQGRRAPLEIREWTPLPAEAPARGSALP